MADTPQTPAPPAQPPAQPPAAPPAEPPATEPAAGSPWDTLGTVLMGIAVAAAAIVLLDIALKGRILGPVIARFAPQPPAEAEQPADG